MIVTTGLHSKAYTSGLRDNTEPRPPPCVIKGFAIFPRHMRLLLACTRQRWLAQCNYHYRRVY